MRVLLLDPLDSPHACAAARLKWARIIDLGLAGAGTYASWIEEFCCPASTLSSLRNGFADFIHIRNLLRTGCGRLVDEYGLDWWEILSILLVEQLEWLVMLDRLAQTIAADEVYISRPSANANVLQVLLGGRLRVFPASRNQQFPKLAHYLDVARKLSASQIIDVLCDKYDPGQQLRAGFSRARQKLQHPVVLIPTAYVNVTRTGIAYANTLPQQDFLLVSTRRSGWMKHLPENVAAAWLSSYAVVRGRSAEITEMQTRWRALLGELLEVPQFQVLNSLGSFDRFPKHLRHGLEVRDAWSNVLDRAPVQAVLCADDSNPYTRIPLLLARERGLPNIACHHGALDGYYAMKRTYGDVVLAKGKMEQDYLVRQCGVPAGRVEIGAPAAPALTALPNRKKQWIRDAIRPQILFVSECYEVGNARALEFYRDVLPPLADLALNTGRKLVVKLHPTESKSERVAMVKRVLSSRQMKVTQVVDGRLPTLCWMQPGSPSQYFRR